MSKPFIVFDQPTGRIVVNRVTKDEAKLEQEYLAEGQDYMEGEADPDSEYILNGTKTSRPEVPQPSGSYDLTQLPNGTVVEVKNEAGDALTISDMSGVLTLVDPGKYIVSVDPPFPYMPIKTTVEVS